MATFTKRILGATGLNVGPLGVAASYGAPAEAFEAAFEKGCNYFYLGSGRHKAGMSRAIRDLCRQGQRARLVVAVQTYARFGFLTELLPFCLVQSGSGRMPVRSQKHGPDAGGPVGPGAGAPW